MHGNAAPDVRGVLNLADFGISAERGFLPLDEPLRRLPEPFTPWDDAALELPKWLVGGRVRERLAALPMLAADELHDTASLERAMLVLSYIGHAWVWGEATPVERIPAAIAVPWHRVARELGRPPILSYASHALRNWRRLDPARAIGLDNAVRLLNFLGGIDEEWFVLIHITIEANAGPALHAAAALQNAMLADDPDVVADSLAIIAATIRSLRSILERMPERCDPYVYFLRVRPFIFGWYGNPALPDGVLYEGVDEWNGRPQRFRGETGAQSAIVPSLDAVLGLRFTGDPEFAEHLAALRDYMPREHRAFVEALESNEGRLGVRGFIERHRERRPDAIAAYNAAVSELFEFRTLHLGLAGSYIAKQQQQANSNPTATGTGGTPFIRYLRDHANQTLTYRL